MLFPRPRDAVKAIKKRIVGNKNFREIMFALTVSNCLSKIVCFSFCVICSVRCERNILKVKMIFVLVGCYPRGDDFCVYLCK